MRDALDAGRAPCGPEFDDDYAVLEVVWFGFIGGDPLADVEAAFALGVRKGCQGQEAQQCGYEAFS